MKQHKRIWEIDFLRGFALFCMIIDHALFDLSEPFAFQSGPLAFLTTFAAGFMKWRFHEPLRLFFVVLFIGISGMMSSFSRSNWSRGLKLLLVAGLLTAAAYFAGPYDIWFGILHMLAVSMLLYALLSRFGNLFSFIFGLLLIAAGIYIEQQGLRSASMWLYPFGWGRGIVTVADYFPLLPWAGIFFLGGVLGNLLYKGRASRYPGLEKSGFHSPFRFLGRHSLWVYLLHQPILWGIFWLLSLLFGYEVNIKFF